MKNIIKTVSLFTVFLSALMVSCSGDSEKSHTKKEDKTVGENVTKEELNGFSENTFEVKSTKVVIEVKEGEVPLDEAQYSPNGKYLSYTYEGTKGIRVMVTKTGKTKSIVDDLDAGYKYRWSADGQYILYKGARLNGRKREEFIATVNVETGEIEVLVDNKHREPLASWSNNKDSQSIVYFDGNNLTELKNYPYKKGFDNTELSTSRIVVQKGSNTSVYEGSTKIFSSDKELLSVEISPDNSKMSYKVMGETQLIYDFETKQTVDIGRGLHAKWSFDSKYLVYQIINDDGHEYTDSELYVVTADGKNKKQITSTPNILEVKPSWSNDGGSIVYSDLNTGKIYKTVFK